MPFRSEVAADPMTYVREGDLHARADVRPPAIAAYLKAVGIFERQQQLLKAIALCRLILKLDPDHSGAKRRLDGYERTLGIPHRT